jgi:uncharacterized membrane protein
MAEVQHEFRADSPTDRVWAVAIDANRIPQWQANVVEVRDMTGRLDQVGSRYSSVNRLAGRTIEGAREVTRVEAGRLVEVTCTAPGGGQAVNRVTFTAHAGATDVSIEFQYELPAGFLGQFANRLFVERALRRDIRHSSENFKALCEEAETA